MRVAAIAAALLLAVAACAPSAPKSSSEPSTAPRFVLSPTPVVFGASVADSIALRIVARRRARLKSAYALLGAGKAHRALRAFDAEMRFWKNDRNNGFGYIDAARGIVIAAIFAREDGRAARELRSLEREYGGEPAGDALVYAGRWNEAFARYRDATQREVGAVGVDPVIAKGVDKARAADFRGAISVWSAPAWVHDERTALIGLALARLGDWSGAEDAWLDATRLGRAVPEWQPLWSGNLTALAMLYHFRDHFARGDGAYRFRVDVGQRA